MKVKSNHKAYEALKYTNDSQIIEEFAGKGSIIQTRLNGIGFAARHEYAINGTYNQFWITPDVVAIKNNDGEVFYLPDITFNEIFKEVK